jgi:hypothetical protein
VIDRHLSAVRRTVDGGALALEGFAQVVVVHTPADAVELSIERRPTPRPG